MKKIRSTLAFLLPFVLTATGCVPAPALTAAALLGFLGAGCANTRATPRIVSVKHTVFGLDVAQDPAGGGLPAFRLGLVRSYWQEIPTGTNPVYAAPITSSTDANIKLSQQTVTEKISTIPAKP